jgi:hypothetical protein
MTWFVFLYVYELPSIHSHFTDICNNHQAWLGISNTFMSGFAGTAVSWVIIFCNSHVLFHARPVGAYTRHVLISLFPMFFPEERLSLETGIFSSFGIGGFLDLVQPLAMQRTHHISKCNCSHTQVRGGRHLTLLGPLQGVNLSHWTAVVPASRKRRRRRKTILDETVMYGYWSSVT